MSGSYPGSGVQIPLVLVLAGLALLPLLLVMITSYAKVAVVLHIFRGALGSAQVPPTLVITGLALVLTGFIMAPTGLKVYQAAQPALAAGALAEPLSKQGVQSLAQAAVKAHQPISQFLLRNSAAEERRIFLELAQRGAKQGGLGAQVRPEHMMVLLPAFAVGQLKAAFLIGFLLFIPFLIVDLVVANVLLALGMHMLAPASVALPFKLLLFVLADGWILLTQGLVLSYV